MPLPFISVCVPVYQGASHLRVCLESVAEQEGIQLEVVVLDDQSRDGSIEIAHDVAKKFPAVRWVIESNPSRHGMVGNWNACLKKTTGDYIKVMGQDDLLLPRCLISQVTPLIERSEYALSAVGCAIYTEAGRRLFYRRKGWATGSLPAETVLRKCLHRAVNPLGEPVAILARRADYLEGGGFDTSLRYYVDVEKSLRMMKNRPVSVIDEPLCGFRIHRGAASFGLQGSAYEEFLCIERMFGSLIERCPSPRRRRWLAAMDSIMRLAFYKIFG